MDKLLNDYLQQIDIKGPLAETLRAVCCYDFGPWVKPARRRTFFTPGELSRCLELARAILEEGNMDKVAVFLINENVNDPDHVTVFRAPKEQYPRFPINYHIGLDVLELPEDGKTTYTKMCDANLVVPVQLFATIFGAALGRFSPYTYNPILLKLHADELEGMIDLDDYSATDVLKAAFINRTMEWLFPAAPPADLPITADFIPSEGMLEHFASIWGHYINPVQEMHLIQLLDASRFYGNVKYFDSGATAILFDDESTHYFDISGRVRIENSVQNPNEVMDKGNYVVIPERYREVMLSAEHNDIVTFFGGTPDPVADLAPQSPGQDAGSFQLDAK